MTYTYILLTFQQKKTKFNRIKEKIFIEYRSDFFSSYRQEEDDSKTKSKVKNSSICIDEQKN